MKVNKRVGGLEVSHIHPYLHCRPKKLELLQHHRNRNYDNKNKERKTKIIESGFSALINTPKMQWELHHVCKHTL